MLKRLAEANRRKSWFGLYKTSRGVFFRRVSFLLHFAASLYVNYSMQLLSKNFIDSDFCHNYLHTLYVFACLL